ncbi:hypothetical protein VNO78_21491 [Psophocarpus tetragonolobus]|uniref:Uncharacterized protein n=1 Tax=Psophocarpus tetragonolobus TaxID=3891 RepID=A0AAN9XI47_PSOTE
MQAMAAAKHKANMAFTMAMVAKHKLSKRKKKCCVDPRTTMVWYGDRIVGCSMQAMAAAKHKANMAFAMAMVAKHKAFKKKKKCWMTNTTPAPNCTKPGTKNHITPTLDQHYTQLCD